MIPYGRQHIDREDIDAVVETLTSGWLTTGPAVARFESDVAGFLGVNHAAAICNGTAALHAAMFAIRIGPGDEVIVPPMTFAASSNCVLYQGGTPVFADVDPETLLIDPERVEEKITPRTKAVIAVDYTGQPCDWDRLNEIAKARGIALVADGCHALGAKYKEHKVGTLADLTVFSFHPVKHIATGEGGMVVTDSPDLDKRVRSFRNHGIEADFRQREKSGSWHYDMTELGYNYRIPDILCALGSSQMKKLPEFLDRRREIAARYDAAFTDTKIRPLGVRDDVLHAYHLYMVRVADRERVFNEMRERGIGVNVHYIPVHLHPYYRENLGTGPGLCPNAEAAYEELLTLPMFPDLTDEEQEQVIRTLLEVA